VSVLLFGHITMIFKHLFYMYGSVQCVKQVKAEGMVVNEILKIRTILSPESMHATHLQNKKE